MKRSNVPHTEKLLLRVDEAAELLSLPRSSAYALVKANIIPSVLVGGRIRVSREALTTYVARLRAEAEEQDQRIRRMARRSA